MFLKWLFFFAIFSVVTACDDTITYGYRYEPIHFCSIIFTTRCYVEYKQIKIPEIQTITCSDASPDVALNYTYRDATSHHLVITNISIPVIPSNSSLSTIPKIDKLTLKNLEIEDISTEAFENLNHLQELDLSYNKFVTVPEEVLVLENLKTLDLSNNQIGSLQGVNFSKLLNLRYVSLKHNNLKSVVGDLFKDLKFLEEIDISHNPLVAFRVTFTSLNRLILRETRLRTFGSDLSNLALDYVDLSNGTLEVINFANVPNVNTINLRNNRVREMENLNIALNIKFLDLSHNKITRIGYVTRPLKTNKITDLDLSFNEIFEIDSYVFWNLENLKTLRIANNNLETLHENTFVNCSSLDTLDLSSNKLSSTEANVFSGVPALTSLNISNNNLETLNLDMLPRGNHVANLFINKNKITTFDPELFLDVFTNLKSISLNNNSWFCEDLVDILHHFKVRKIAIKDASAESENQGVACKFHKSS